MYSYKQKVLGNAYVIFNYFEQLEEGRKVVLARKLHIQPSCFSSVKRQCVETSKGTCSLEG